MDEVERWLNEEFGEYCVVTRGADLYIDVQPIGVSKGHSARKLKELLGNLRRRCRKRHLYAGCRGLCLLSQRRHLKGSVSQCLCLQRRFHRGCDLPAGDRPFCRRKAVKTKKPHRKIPMGRFLLFICPICEIQAFSAGRCKRGRKYLPGSPGHRGHTGQPGWDRGHRIQRSRSHRPAL